MSVDSRADGIPVGNQELEDKSNEIFHAIIVEPNEVDPNDDIDGHRRRNK